MGKKAKEIKIDGKSLDIINDKINKLKEIIPEVFTESNKLDIDKLKKTLGEFVNEENERYVLNWAGKSEAFRILQTQTTATLAPDKKESKNFDTTENIFIEGENLEVLKVLQKSYFGKIKMIYIDPPYNTGNDSFIYPDKFSETKDEYLKRIGEKDEEGFLLKEGLFRKNSKESGRYHSNWLSMMYPRLFLSRNLLKEDGVIFVSIDDNEVHNMRMVMNEIFGEENFIGIFCWRKKAGAGADSKYFFRQHENIVLFSKKIDFINALFQPLTEKQKLEYKNPDNDPRGKWAPTDLVRADDNDPKRIYKVYSPTGKEFEACWSYTKENFNQLEEQNLIWWGKNNNSKPKRKRFLDKKEGLTPRSWIDYFLTSDGSKDISKLKLNNIFDFPKPVGLIKHFLQIGILSKDIVLDFFAGSGTTAQAVLELNKEDDGNRKFILVQLPEKTAEDSEAYKAGFKTISDICQERIKRVIKKLESEIKNEQLEIGKEYEKKLDLGFKIFRLKNSNFKLWRGDVIENEEDLKKQLSVFDDTMKKGAEEENMIYELLLKLGYDLNVNVKMKEIKSNEVEKTKKEKHKKNIFGHFRWWEVDSGKLIIVSEASKPVSSLFNQFSENKLNPEKVICFDRIFKGDDEAKTNLVLQMRDAGVEFKTV